MTDEIDLEKGEPESSRERRSRRRSSSSSSSSVSGESKTTSDKLDNELNARLIDAFNHIQEWREARDDQELAVAIAEDKEKMSRGLVSLTHVFSPVRKPLVIFLGFIEPVLAFGRVGRILAGRFFGWRQQRAEAIAQAQAEWDAEHAPQPVYQ